MTATLRLLLWAALALGLFAVVRPAQAACGLPLCTCSVTTTPVAFPNVNPLAGGNTDGIGSFLVKCGGVAGLGISYTVALGTGSGSYTTRRMTSGAYSLNYNLYLDSNRTSVWGDGTGSTVVGSGNIALDVLGLSPGVTHYVYGRIPAQGLAAPANYTDTITVTVTYN